MGEESWVLSNLSRDLCDITQGHFTDLTISGMLTGTAVCTILRQIKLALSKM